MSTNFLSRNMRGTRDQGKTVLLKRKIRKWGPLGVAIQETKVQMVLQRLVKHLWGVWLGIIPAQGASGGIFTMWDAEKLELVSSLEGAFSLPVELRSKGEIQT